MTDSMSAYHGNLLARDTSARADAPAGSSKQASTGRALVPRKLRRKSANGRESTCTEGEFFAQRGPLVVLGEPGMGKSTLLEQFAKESGSDLVQAVNIGAKRPKAATLPKKLLVDAVDEVAICDPGRSVTFVLERLGDHRDANFVLACRSADWDMSTRTRIHDIWGMPPTVGELLPLGPDEIASIVHEELPESEASEFLRVAGRDGILGLLGNPQHLVMLIGAVRNGGWPDSKARLYQSACKMLVTEANETYLGNQPPDQPSSEELLDCAGFVCAQLMLSGNSRVRIRLGEGTIPTASKLTGGGFAEGLIRRCLGTRLFAHIGEDTYEPCHRTVAEYLAAQWLSESVQNRTLSARDVETVMCVGEEQVPGALRGLHAWFATHRAGKNPQWLADRFIERDPYGFWCYGDRGELGDASAVKLLGALAKTQKENPHFYGHEGRTFIGNWPTGPALQEHILTLLGEESTPPTIIALLVDSIRGSVFVGKVDKKLTEIVLDKDSPVGIRRTCLDCLASRKDNADIDGMVKDLAKQGIDSLSIAVDGAREHTHLVSADTIVEVLIAAGTQRHYLGMGQHGIEEKMTEEQLRDGLEIMVRLIKKGKPPDAVEEARRWIIRLLGRLLEMGATPDAHVIWGLLRKSYVGQQREGSWHRRSLNYFKEHTPVRRAVQEYAIRSMGEIDPWARPWDITRVSPGLSFTKEDLVHHLDRLGKPEKKEQADLWHDLIMISLAEGHGEIVKRELAKARGNRNLHDAAMKIEETKKNLRAQYVPQVAEPVTPETQEWRRQLAEKRDEIARGEHLGLLMHAANTCLGLDIVDDSTEDTCRARLLSFVGTDLVNPVINGIRRAATKKENHKTPRELAKSRARWEIDPYAAVLKAYCHLQVADNKKLTLSPQVARSALAVQHLALGWHRNGVRRKIIDMLEPTVYASKRQRERYIRDITEPMLDTKEDDIAGIALLENNDLLSDVAGPLALEWLESRPRLRDAAFWSLLATVEKRIGNGKAAEFVRKHTPRAKDADRTLRERMMAATFALNFPKSHAELTAFAEEDRNHFWVLRDSLQQLHHRNLDSDWSIGQSRFMLSTFATSWPNVRHPGGMLGGDQHPWLAAFFLQARIDSLERNPSPDASKALEELVKSADLGDYADLVKAARENQRRLRFEKETSLFGLTQVRGVLLRKAPANHRHLQKVVLEKLEELQVRIRHGDTNPDDAYWNESTPKSEEQCRDRIKDALEEAFSAQGNFNIVAEALMPGRRRSDLQCRHEGPGPAISVPIEVKGQWHPELWTAAATQLGEYVKTHGANKTGIYVVLWFGPRHRLRVPKSMPRPKTAPELKAALDKWHADIPYKLETFVLDLSRRHGRETKAKTKTTRKASPRRTAPARAKRPKPTASTRKSPISRKRSAETPAVTAPRQAKDS